MTGGGDIVAKLRKVQEDAKKGAQRGLQQAGQLMLQVSNSRVPHEEGDLERDGAVHIDPDALRVAVSYGHDELNGIKALVNHEDLTLKHDPGRSAKFLETAMQETRDRGLAILAQQVKVEMGTTDG